MGAWVVEVRPLYLGAFQVAAMRAFDKTIVSSPPRKRGVPAGAHVSSVLGRLGQCKALGTEPKETGVQGPVHCSLNQRRDPRYLGQQEIRKHNKTIKNLNRGFPGGAVVESLPASAGDAGSSPGLGRSHILRSSSAREPQLLSLCVWSLCSATRGRDEEWPPLAATGEGPRTEAKTQHSHTYIHTYIHKKNVSRQE